MARDTADSKAKGERHRAGARAKQRKTQGRCKGQAERDEGQSSGASKERHRAGARAKQRKTQGRCKGQAEREMEGRCKGTQRETKGNRQGQAKRDEGQVQRASRERQWAAARGKQIA